MQKDTNYVHLYDTMWTIKPYFSVVLYLAMVLVLTGLSSGIVLSSESVTGSEEATEVGGAEDVSWEEGDLDRLLICGEPPVGGVPPGDTLED